MKKSDFQTAADRILKLNKEAKEVFICSNGQSFFEEARANAYASRLKDKEVCKYDRNPGIKFSAAEPAATEPASEPAATEPTATEPAATEPATTEPAATEPATTEPAATEPATTEPAATEPAATEPSATKAEEPTFEQLAAKYELLFGKKPAQNIKIETLKSKIAEKEGK